jgi:hypothetical protein
MTLTLMWEPTKPIDNDATLFVHILDQSGNRVAGVDVPPTGPERPTSHWQPGTFPTSVQPIALPADLAAGAYWVTIGLYDSETTARLPLHGAPKDNRLTSGSDSLTLGSFEVVSRQ